MTFSFHPDAEAEFYEAIDYYERCETGLGRENRACYISFPGLKIASKAGF